MHYINNLFYLNKTDITKPEMKCVARCTSFFIDDTLLQKRFEIHCFLYVRVGKFEDVYSLCTFIKHLVSCGGCHNWLLYFPREENIFFSGEKTLDMSPVHFYLIRLQFCRCLICFTQLGFRTVTSDVLTL